ncbi:MAG: TenA family transcriptional regulator [Rhodospirillales bacterium]
MADKIGMDAAKEVVAIRERWHTMKHPFFQQMKDGKLPLRALGVYMAQHFRFVEMAQPSFGFLLWRAPADIRRSLVENLAEEEGLQAIPVPGHVPHDHNKMIFDFCKAVGIPEAEARAIPITPAWWARRLHYAHVMREEPLGAVLAMQSTQEGQQVRLNLEITLPAFEKYYGYKRDAEEIAFFAEHAEADREHSERQLALCAKYIDTPEVAKRAFQVSEEACRLRWASITEVYRTEVLGEKEIMPPGIAA